MSNVVIADKYQCPRIDGKFMKEHKVLKRKGLKTTVDYVEEMNSANNGMLLIIDEEATEQNRKAREEQQAERLAKKQLKSLGGGHVLDALINRAAGKVVEPKTEKAPKVEKEKDGKPSLKELRLQYPAIKATSVDKFLEEVAKLETPSERKTQQPED